MGLLVNGVDGKTQPNAIAFIVTEHSLYPHPRIGVQNLESFYVFRGYGGPKMATGNTSIHVLVVSDILII